MATGTNEEKLGACCVTEYRPLAGTPNGEIIKVTDLDTYFIAGKDDKSKGKVIVLLTDIFGKYHAWWFSSKKSVCDYETTVGLVKNPRIIADELSEKSGFDVYVPDILNGDPYPSSFMKLMPEVAGEKLSIGARVSISYYWRKYLYLLCSWAMQEKWSHH